MDVFIVHRWNGTPEGDWYQWLKGELEKRGFEVFIPEMPETDKPSIKKWVGKISEAASASDEPYFVGHSIGCQAILRYIESSGKKSSGVLLIAPWLHLKDAAFETDSDRKVAEEWISIPIDLGKVKSSIRDCRIVMSTGDPYVPVGDSKIFRDGLNAKINIMPISKHFTGEEGYSELHVALNEFMKMVPGRLSEDQ